MLNFEKMGFHLDNLHRARTLDGPEDMRWWWDILYDNNEVLEVNLAYERWCLLFFLLLVFCFGNMIWIFRFLMFISFLSLFLQLGDLDLAAFFLSVMLLQIQRSYLWEGLEDVEKLRLLFLESLVSSSCSSFASLNEWMTFFFTSGKYFAHEPVSLKIGKGIIALITGKVLTTENSYRLQKFNNGFTEEIEFVAFLPLTAHQ